MKTQNLAVIALGSLALFLTGIGCGAHLSKASKAESVSYTEPEYRQGVIEVWKGETVEIRLPRGRTLHVLASGEVKEKYPTTGCGE